MFFEGSEEQRTKSLNAAQDEMNGMHDKQVLEQLNRKNLKEAVDLGPGNSTPKILSTKLVTSRKPDENGGKEDPKAKAVSEPPWRAKVRLCG